jgi:hypothetical protein
MVMLRRLPPLNLRLTPRREVIATMKADVKSAAK